MSEPLKIGEALGNVTDTLVHAVEEASELAADHVLVLLYTTRRDSTKLDVLASDGLNMELVNWMLDKVKQAILADDEKDDDD